jgi:hypothetical protein
MLIYFLDNVQINEDDEFKILGAIVCSFGSCAAAHIKVG